MPTPIESPNTLETNKKPIQQKRIGKKPMLIAIFFFTLIALMIMYNISTRQAANLKRATEEAKNFQPATQLAENMNNNIPNTINIPAQQSIVLQSENENGLSKNDLTAQRELEKERGKKLSEALEANSGIDQFKAADEKLNIKSSQLNQANAADGKSNLKSSNPIVPALSMDKEIDQNQQAQKDIFLEKSKQNQYAQYLDSTRKAPLSQFEIKTGTIIPSILITGINSDLPGQIIGQVTENVYDTATGGHLLIPQGTKIYGLYDSHIAYAQSRLLVAWQRLIYPDASTIEIEAMSGADKSGYAGFNDQVNNHYAKLIGFGLATSAFSSLFQISQRDNISTNGVLTPSQIAAASTAQNMTQLGIDVTKRNLNIQPTIEIRPGYRFLIIVNKDIIFPGTYGTH